MAKRANNILLHAHHHSGGDIARADVAADRSEFPCSVAQERFWLLDRLDPGNSAYNVAVRWRLEGRVSSDLLQRSWAKILERHEILRTRFLEVGGAPIQQLLAHSPFKMAEIDLSTLPQDQQQAEADRIGVIEARAPFDLESGPLIRVTLLRFSPTVAIVLVTTHQIVSDGWSIGVMAREMGLIYEAMRHETAIALEPLPIQYADYSLWQLEWLKVRGTAAETAYWSKQLAGVKPFKVLPDHPRPAVPTTNGAIVSRVLPRELTNQAQALSAQRGATLFAAALASLCAMLSRYTGEDEIVLGTQVSDRDQVELEPMIGQFVNSLVLRNGLSDDPTFTELVDRVRDTISQALDHRHIPIEQLLGMIKAERSENAAPISVNFIFQKSFIQNTQYGDFLLIDLPSLPAGAIYDLNFFMVERPDGWRFSCQYNTDQFDAATATRLLAYFQNGLESAVANPSQRVSQLRLDTSDEPRRLLDGLNDTRSHDLQPHDLQPHDRVTATLLQKFAAHAASSPQASAVICGTVRVSYGELSSRSDRLAQFLRTSGIGVGARVAVCMDRSADLLSALLAVMKVGATCVPLNPADPPVYSDQLARLADSKVILTLSRYRAGWTSRVPIIELDRDLPVAAALGDRPFDARVSPASAAFVVFAADTYKTGVHPPNCVPVSHLLWANLLDGVGTRIGLGSHDVHLALSPVSLDVAMAELFLPLFWGGCLVIATPKEARQPRDLMQLLRRSDASVLHAIPATWSGLIRAGWSGKSGFKMLYSRGTIDPAILTQLLGCAGEIWALYGEPGVAMWSAARRVVSPQPQPVMGEPLANTAVRLQFRTSKEALIGATGTLEINADSRWNGTDQLARLRADGQIELLDGRTRWTWHQGQRIMLAQMEARLLQNPRVAAAVCRCRASVDENIEAHIVPQDTSASIDGLQDTLRGDLAKEYPAYLNPTSIFLHQFLPRTRDGEVGLRMLQTASTARDAQKSSRTLREIETRLTTIWSSMLALEDVAPTANFFELGGHSLLAARMLARLDSEFGRRLTLATLFRDPTIRGLARVLDEKEPRDFDFRQMVKLQPNGSRPPIIAINNTGNYFLLAKYLAPDQPFTSLQLFDPSVNTATMPQTLEEVAAGYVQLIRRVQPSGPYRIMGWCVAGALAFEIACQLSDSQQEVLDVFLMDAWIPRYIGRLPFWRRLISEQSLRWQLVKADWHRFTSGLQTFSSFVKNRLLVRKLHSWLASASASDENGSAPRQFSSEEYDQWLLKYLQTITAKYEPRSYSGRVTLFRSNSEPTGWCFDPHAGWSRYTSQGVDLVMVSGNHYSMFQNPGAGQIAERITSARPIK